MVLTLAANGKVKMRGKLADGTPFTTTSALNTRNGFPLYVALYGTKGSVAGNLGFSSAPRLEASSLIWFRPATTAPRFAAGWPGGIGLGFDGAPRNKVTEPNVLPLGFAELALSGGGLDAAGFAKRVRVMANRVISVPQRGPDKTAITLKPTGEWKGTLIHPVTGKSTAFGGVVVRQPDGQGIAFGCFLSPTAAGSATLSHTP